MHALLYAFIFFSLMILIGILLRKILRINLYFVVTFILLSCFILSIAVWETEIVGTFFYLYTLWGMSVGVVCASFVVMYVVLQYMTKHTVHWKKTLMLVIFVIGIYFAVGMLEDFSCFIIWGLDKFTPAYAVWFPCWIGDVIPCWYLMAILGIWLIFIALWGIRKIEALPILVGQIEDELEKLTYKTSK